jgi:hypothetical protein
MITSSDWYKKSILINYSPPEMLKIHYFRTEHLVVNDENRNEVDTLVLEIKRIMIYNKNLLNLYNNYEVPLSAGNLMISNNLAFN